MRALICLGLLVVGFGVGLFVETEGQPSNLMSSLQANPGVSFKTEFETVAGTCQTPAYQYWRTSRERDFQVRRHALQLEATYSPKIPPCGQIDPLDFLPPHKRIEVRKILLAEDEEIARMIGNVQFNPAPRLREIRSQFQSQIASALTPMQLVQYEIRFGQLSARMRSVNKSWSKDSFDTAHAYLLANPVETSGYTLEQTEDYRAVVDDDELFASTMLKLDPLGRKLGRSAKLRKLDQVHLAQILILAKAHGVGRTADGLDWEAFKAGLSFVPVDQVAGIYSEVQRVSATPGDFRRTRS